MDEGPPVQIQALPQAPANSPFPSADLRHRRFFGLTDAPLRDRSIGGLLSIELLWRGSDFYDEAATLVH
jgi:hypothetical protein